jgi:hypothetical protein
MTVYLFILFILFVYLYFCNDPYHIVVARYKEDTSWLDGYRYVKIYNKYSGTNLLPNIGRESHTYLHYIIENYDNLPDVVFFTQGSIGEHNSRPIEYYINIKEDISETYWSQERNKDEKFRVIEYGDSLIYPANEDFLSWFKKHIKSDIGDVHKWYVGAIFSVKKNKILTRSKKFYEDLISQIPDHPNPEIGHFFERSWYYIFNGE